MSKKKKLLIAAGAIANVAIIWKVFRKHRNIIKENEDLRLENQELNECARKDELTGLKNRYALREDFDSFLGKNVTMIVMDIDSFKQFNDTNGHFMGDEVLKTVAKELMLFLEDANCYRYGGDEFVIISEEEDPTVIEEQMRDMQVALDFVSVVNLDLSVGVTYGSAFGKVESKEDFRKLFQMADQNLYEAKSNKSMIKTH